MGGRVNRAAALLLSVVAGVLAAVAVAAPASAHNSLVGSDPKDGARLAKAPASVRLTFLSRLDPRTTKVTVTGPDGRSASGGAPAFDRAKVAVPLEPGAAGRYTVGYEVASGDGHPVKGKIQFTLTVGATPSASPSPSLSSTPSPSAPVAVSLAPVAAEEEDGGTPWWPWALAAAGVLIVAAGAVAVRRRAQR